MMAGTQDCRFTQPGMWTKRLCLGPLVRSARNSSLTAVRFTPSGQLAISLFFASATVVEGGKVSSMVCASAKKNLTRKSIFAAALAGALNAGPSRRPGRRSQVRDGKYRSATAREEPWLLLLPAPVPPASRSSKLPQNQLTGVLVFQVPAAQYSRHRLGSSASDLLGTVVRTNPTQ